MNNTNYKILNKLLGTDYWVKCQACIEGDSDYYLCWLHVSAIDPATGICTVSYINLEFPEDWDWVDWVDEPTDDIFNNVLELSIDDICIDEPVELLTTVDVFEDMQICLEAARETWAAWENTEDDEE